jgi:hypothetical protein
MLWLGGKSCAASRTPDPCVVGRRRTKPGGAPVRGTPTRHFWPLMRIAFRATEGGFQADEYALVCGLTGIDADGAEHYLNFQRSPEGSDG